MCWLISCLLLLLLQLGPSLCAGLAVTAHDLVAELDYGSFQGAYSEVYNISYWKKIPFAAPPVGENRFRRPQGPEPIHGIYNSSQDFDMCPQRTVNGSEDCLYLGLYSRPWSRGQALRPVVVTFYGGGFIQGSASFGIPPSAYPILNVSAETDLIVVYPNYRVNAFGFLPGRQVADDPHSDLNVALLDQRAALEWVQRHIREFGGDPDNVAIWGQSAGGGSVIAQAIASQPRSSTTPSRRRLFNKAWASSPFWPKTYRYDSDEAQALYDTLAELTGCAGRESLRCLKDVDVQTIREANLKMVESHKYTTSTFTWAPVIDDDFLPLPLSEATAIRNRRLHQVQSGFGMYNTREGESFTPPGLASITDIGEPPFNSSEASFDKWLHGYLPGLHDHHIAAVKGLYPANGRTETLSYNSTVVRAGLIYRDTVLACPAHWMAGAAAKERGWLGEYTIPPALHASDVYWWNTLNEQQVEDPLHYKGDAGAFASFFATGDPNARKLTGPEVAGAPPLGSGLKWIMDEAGFDVRRLDELPKRCDFWRRVGHRIPI